MSYHQLCEDAKRMRQIATNCYIEFGKDSKEYREALQELQIVNMRLQNIEASIGNTQIGTGNYAHKS